MVYGRSLASPAGKKRPLILESSWMGLSGGRCPFLDQSTGSGVSFARAAFHHTSQPVNDRATPQHVPAPGAWEGVGRPPQAQSMGADRLFNKGSFRTSDFKGGNVEIQAASQR